MYFVSAAVEIERTDILADSEFPRVLQARCGGAPVCPWLTRWARISFFLLFAFCFLLFAFCFLLFAWLLGFVCCRVLISLLACLQRSIMVRSQNLHKTLHASGSYLPFHLMPAHV
jgi:hypothetical protein